MFRLRVFRVKITAKYLVQLSKQFDKDQLLHSSYVLLDPEYPSLLKGIALRAMCFSRQHD